MVLVSNAAVPAKTLPELLAYIRANPGGLSYASFGTGTVSHIYGDVLSRATGGTLVHVPYKGSADAMRDLLAGRVKLMFDSPSIVAQYVSTNQLRIYGTAGDRRRSTMPDVPTLLEQGLPGFDLRSWNAFFASSVVPRGVLEKLNTALRHAQEAPSVAAALQRLAFEPVDESLEDSAQLWRRDYNRWGEYLRKANIRLD